MAGADEAASRRLVAVRHLAGGVEHPAEPVPAGDAARQLGQHPADRPYREGQHGEQEGDADQFGHVDRALPQAVRADHQHREGAEAGQGLQHRVEDAAQSADGDQRVPQLAGAVGEPAGLLSLPAHCLDHQRAVEALVGDAADLGPEPLGASLTGRHPAGVGHVEREQRREHRQADQGERPVGDEQRGHGADQHHQRADREGQRGDRVPGRFHVGVRVGQQGAGGVPLVPGQRQLQIAAGDPAPVVGLEPVLHVARAEPPAEDADHPQHADAEQRRGRQGERAACRPTRWRPPARPPHRPPGRPRTRWPPPSGRRARCRPPRPRRSAAAPGWPAPTRPARDRAPRD